MALQYSATSKLVNCLAKGVVANSAYCLRGAWGGCKLDPNLVVGESQIVRMNNITAEELSALGGDTLSNGLAHETAEIAIRVFGTALTPTMLEAKLNLGDMKSLVKEICPAVANKAAKEIAISDMIKIGEAGNMSVATGTAQWKRLASTSADLQANYTGAIYGFAAPQCVGQLIGEGRSMQPITVEAAYGKDLLGSIFAVKEMRTMVLPTSVNAKNTATATASYVAGSTYTLSGVASAAFKVNEFIVTADGCVLVSYLDGTTQKWKCLASGTWQSTDAAKSFAPIIMRVENAEVFTSATDCIDGSDGDTSDNVEGLSVKMHKRPSGKSFEEIYEFGVGMLCGIGCTAKARVLWFEVA